MSNREGHTEKMTLKQRPAGGKVVSHSGDQRRSVPSRQNNRAKPARRTTPVC